MIETLQEPIQRITRIVFIGSWVSALTWASTWGLPTITSNAWARVMATLKRFGLLKKPRVYLRSTFTNVSRERTYINRFFTKYNQVSTASRTSTSHSAFS